MISHSHKFIFVHIPRCGGTNVEDTLRVHASPVTGCDWAVETKKTLKFAFI